MNFVDYPKLELHLHLDSSLTFKAAQKIDSTLSQHKFTELFIAPDKCANLPDYLSRVAKQVEFLQTTHALKVATEGLLEKLKEDNVIYAEIRFAPLLHTMRGLSAEEVVDAVNSTIEADNTNLVVNIILCNVRHFSRTQSMQTVELINEFKSTNVVGLDLAGDEKGYPLSNHIPAYEYAREHDIAVTAHAGEACGPSSVRESLEKLQTKRLGHGVRSFESPELVEHLVNQDIHLEVCPTSNIQTNVYDTYANHTVSQLFEKGVSLSINTDGRTTSNVSLSQEYQKIHEAFGWGKNHFLKCNLNALKAAFLQEDKKEQLAGILKAAYA